MTGGVEGVRGAIPLPPFDRGLVITVVETDQYDF